jgi:hypothetical protein
VDLIQQRWEEFQGKVISADTDQESLDIMRTCFFAGVIAFMKISSESDNPEVAVSTVNSIKSECERFVLERLLRNIDIPTEH